VFVTKMPVIRIVDLATTLIELVAPVYGRHPKEIAVRYTGKRPGEKLWEELSTEEESHRILEGDRYLVILPALRALLKDADEHYRYPGLDLRPSDAVYHSEHEPKMSQGEIVEFLLRPGVLPDEIRPRALELHRLRGVRAKVA
jgi:hypothetical protein